MFIICSETDVVVREPPQVHSLQRLLQPVKIQLLLSLSMKNSPNCTGVPAQMWGELQLQMKTPYLLEIAPNALQQLNVSCMS